MTRSSGRAVYSTAAGKAKSSRKAAGSAPSSRSAAGDLWNGFKPQPGSAVRTAEGLAGQQGSGPAPLAMMVLGLGLFGALASTALLGARRRKAEIGPSSRSSSVTD